MANNLWNMELELKALKTILTPDSEWSRKLFGACKADHFYHRHTRELYDLVKEIQDAGNLEIPSHRFLLEDGRLDPSVRDMLVSSFADLPLVESQGDFDYLVGQLNGLTKLRALYQAAQQAGTDILEGPDGESKVRDVIDKLGEKLIAADDREDLTTQVVLGRGYNVTAELSYQRIMSGLPDTAQIKTGFKEFDTRTGGHRRTNLVIVGAGSGHGKSLFALNLMIRQYRLGYNVVLVSYEMTEDEVLIRILACISEVDMNKIQTQTCTPREIERVEAAYREFLLLGHQRGNHYTIICPKDETTVPEIGFRVKALKPDSLILDYINLLASSGGAGGQTAQWQELGDISRDAKLLANKLDCVVYLLAQIDDTYNLRYSKAIKDHANFVMGWILDEQARVERMINIQQMKARNAPCYPWSLGERYDIAQFRDPGQGDRTDWPEGRQLIELMERCREAGLIPDVIGTPQPVYGEKPLIEAPAQAGHIVLDEIAPRALIEITEDESL